MGFQYQKAKSASKLMLVKGPKLEKVILSTLKEISDLVGATLGPGGSPVILERPEFNLPPMVTKDGVTVIRNQGFPDPVQHCILETVRDAAIRTASEAGDGTTTATVLSYAITERISAFCKENPRISPQRVVRKLEDTFRDHIEPLVKALASPAKLEDDIGRALLEAVAKVSANGDGALAEATMKCFDLVGDSGNVTISESSGASRYEVEKINGFPIGVGLETCCLRFVPDFINDPGSQRCVMPKCGVILYHGRVGSYASLTSILQKVHTEFTIGTDPEYRFPAVLVVATGFSDDTLTGLAVNFKQPGTMKVFPLVAPMTAETGSQLQFLHDLAAITGATILDQTGIPLEQAQLLHVGKGVDTFEASRWRSNLIMLERSPDDDELATRIQNEREERILEREAAVQQQLGEGISEMTRLLIQERLAKLTGGIARLKVIGASNGELKEKRDRAEDAVCGVRGAIKHGCLPGGCWTLLKVVDSLQRLQDPILQGTLIPALQVPFQKLLQNSGIIDHDEMADIAKPIVESLQPQKGQDGQLRYFPKVFDALEGKHVLAYRGGILDSVPAVLEAIRNSISIASQMGTCGGVVVFPRDAELERYEAKQTAEYLREESENAVNPADERG